MAQTKDDKSAELLIALARLAVLAIFATMALVVMLRLADHFRPRIGDIISFYPKRAIPPDTVTNIEVTQAGMAPDARCLLDVRAMRMSGGSLIIEAVRAKSRFAYHVHWAGGSTSDTPASCGSSAELLLSQEEIAVLKMAATQ